MVGNLRLRQLVRQRVEGILDLLDGAVVLAALVGQICRVHRMDDERICVFLAEGQHIA